MGMSCYGYTRVSSTGQVKGYGPARQREDIQAFAETHGYTIVQWFEDAHTGMEEDRPQFMEMLAAMMGNGVKVVIVESLDRLSREHVLQSVLLSKLDAEGLTLIAANTGADVIAEMRLDPMRKAMFQIQAIFSELDKSLLVKKLARGRTAKRTATGRCEGRKPFGHYNGEAQALDRIHQLRRKPRNGDRCSFGAVAKTLNKEAVATRTGKPWTRATVQKICKANGWE